MTLPIATESAFFLDLYARYRRDPGAVPADWRVHFEALDGADSAAPQGGCDLAARLLAAWRSHGHREARLDPLGLSERPAITALARLRDEAQPQAGRTVATLPGSALAPASIGALIAWLERLYAGAVGLEAEQIADEEARLWLYQRFEALFDAETDPAQQERAQESIALADSFERFVQVKFPSKKRFGVEGAESSIVFLRELLREACLGPFAEAVMGGMHRGRLATLATVLGKPVGTLLAEIKGRDLTAGGPDYTGDVPYHLGYAGEIAHGGRKLKISLSPHPSHLLTVAPVVTGLARARRDGRDDDAVLCLLLHTDAAFSGQGVAAELVQLGGLAGYSVGGTIHLVVNNQIGFTTTASEGRSSLYCTDIAKSVGAPVLHVNGDDSLAVARVAQLALEWRVRFRRDIFVDLVCYRRNGHNELDEPRFTQPTFWGAIDARPCLRESFGSCESVDRTVESFREALQHGYAGIDRLRHNDGAMTESAWAGIARAGADAVLQRVETGLPLERLRALGDRACAMPEATTPHPKVTQFYQTRRDSIAAGSGINLATAEALAFASLLAEGASVRLSGQDSVRGTFTQRHLAIHDVHSGKAAMPLAGLATPGAVFEAVNSPLSEYAVLGFEYGFSLADPRRLVLWEAQFGDFLNGAQIMVDQFIVSAEAKWQMMSGLAMLLPHGLEGQGPDHSSARIERLLQLCAGGNVIVANPSTPANLFHLLRRQIVAPWRKPLFVIAAKSLLRQKTCVSTLDEMGPGTAFSPVIADEASPQARRVVLCSGKIGHELARARETAGQAGTIALIRIEQLYPFPEMDLLAALAPFAGADLVWCQEEPENQGAAAFVMARMRQLGCEPALVARPPLPVAAGGSIERHESEQAALLQRALAPPAARLRGVEAAR